MADIIDIINNSNAKVQIVLNAEDLRTLATEIVNQVNNHKCAQETYTEDEWLTRQGVMDYLHIKSTTLWQWNKKGILTPTKINRKCLYRKSDILALQKGHSSERTGGSSRSKLSNN